MPQRHVLSAACSHKTGSRRVRVAAQCVAGGARILEQTGEDTGLQVACPIMIIIFLDFDGVLRRDSSPQAKLDADCLQAFESAVRRLPADTEIVISSTWRDVFSVKELRALFSPDISTKVVGVTSPLETVGEYQRYREIQRYLRKRGSNSSWIAIDDQAEDLFPPAAPVLSVDPSVGFDESKPDELVEFVSKTLQRLSQ